MFTKRKVIPILIIPLALVLGLFFLHPRSVRAAEFRGGDVVIILADEVIDDDLFISANRVEVRGTVLGDLFATGSEVSVSGTVAGSLGISGQTLEVDGQVEGSLYGAGYSLTVGSEASIGRNIYFGGFSLELEDGSQVGRGLYMGGYQAIVGGDVAADVSVGTAALEVTGTVGGDVVGSVGDPDQSGTPFMPNFPGSVPLIAPGLRVTDSATVRGVVDVEETAFASTDPDGGPNIGFGARVGKMFQERVGEFLAVLLVGGLILRFWSNGLQTTSTRLQEKPLPSTGWGCVVSVFFAIGVPIAGLTIFLLAVLGGLVTFGQLFNDILGVGAAALGLIVASFGFIVSVVSKAVVSFLVGRLLVDQVDSDAKPGWWRDFASLAIGALIYGFLRAIPVLGWVLSVFVTLAGLGAIFYLVFNRWLDTAADTDVPVEAPA
jgi:hypothetical protein